MEGLCILLIRLSYPCRYSDVVCSDVLDFVYDTHSHRITRWNPTVLSPADPQIYSDAFAAKGAALQNCFGFIDGAIRPIRRPGEQQRILYNGHKKFHSINFQAVALPNGPIGNFYGPAGQWCTSETIEMWFFFLVQTEKSPHKGNLYCLIYIFTQLYILQILLSFEILPLFTQQRSALLRFKHTNSSNNSYFAFF